MAQRPCWRHTVGIGAAHGETSTISSTSTGAPSGSSLTPTAERACFTGVTEHLAEGFRRTIDDGRLPGEPVGRRHESDDLDDADDRVDSDKVVDRG